MSAVFRAYRTLLHRYPFTCQVLQTGVLMGAGDVIAQTVVEKKPLEHVNYLRTAQFSAVGIFFVGPALTTWYAFLARRLGNGGKTATFKKVAADQLLFAPVCLFLFIGILNTLQGRSVAETKGVLQRDYADIIINNWKVWPAVQLANFYLVPLHYQVLVVQIVAIFWNVYLSYKTRHEPHQ